MMNAVPNEELRIGDVWVYCRVQSHRGRAKKGDRFTIIALPMMKEPFGGKWVPAVAFSPLDTTDVTGTQGFVMEESAFRDRYMKAGD